MKRAVFIAGLLLELLGRGIALGAADRFTFSADRTEAVLAQGRERTILSGNAQVTTRDTEITAERIELYGEDFRYLICTGAIRVRDNKNGFILLCQNLFYDREIDFSRIQGESEMIDQKNALIVKGAYLENWGQENLTIIQVGVRIVKEDESGIMTCRAEYARYNREREQLELSGMPQVRWKGDDYAAARISVDLGTDEITLEGRVSGLVSTESRETEGE
ncbi:MAG: organic solvent tolerance protein OstA [Spirochaetales bacterium]|nr:organic solvent tolerance protein OstA [Spirochaetales bacterium]